MDISKYHVGGCSSDIPSSCFPVSVNLFGACYITGQWGKFRTKQRMVLYILAHCFQLDILKKIFRIFSIRKNFQITKDRWHIYLTKYFFTEIRSLEKSSW